MSHVNSDGLAGAGLANREQPVSERYRHRIVEAFPEWVMVLSGDGTVVHINSVGLAMIGEKDDATVLGTCFYTRVSPAQRQTVQHVSEGVFTGEPGGRVEFCLCPGAATSRSWFESIIVPLKDDTATVSGALSVTREVSARKEAERRDLFLVQLDDATRALSDPYQIAGTVTARLIDYLSADRCVYAEINAETGTFHVIGVSGPDSASMRGEYPLATFGAEFLERINTGRPHILEAAESAVAQVDGLAILRSWGVSAGIVVPLIKGGGRRAFVAIQSKTARKWRTEEVEIVELAASRCWDSIQRARSERELRKREEEFRTLANAIPNLAWMAHADGHIFWYNGGWYDYTGTTPAQMKTLGWQSVHDPSILPGVLERWNVSLATGEPFEMVFPLRGADGQFRSFLTRVRPVRDEGGKVLRWVGTNTDISAQQDTELREKKARQLAEILNRVGPVVTAELDTKKLTQKITDIATQAIRANFGAFFHSLVDDRGESYVLYTLSGVPAEAFSQFPMPRNTGVFGPTFRGEGVVRSNDITKDPRYGKNAPYSGMPAGHLPVRSYLAVPVRTRNGTVLGGLFFGHAEAGIFTDESEAIVIGIAAQAAIAMDNASLFAETKRGEEALRRSNEELHRLNEDLNQFAYSASHDLREPLRMVSIYTQFLSRKVSGQLDEEGQEFLAYILRGASRMEALIRDLLAYTQATETIETHGVWASGDSAMKQVLENLGTAIEEARAKIVVATLPAVKIPEVHLTQLLQNLIENAVKYRGKSPLEVTVDAVRVPEGWEFSVSDNGIGIEEQYKELIFGVFKRLHTINEYPGTGIGLAICQRIVQRADGRIWVESSPGRGSTFRFTLPGSE